VSEVTAEERAREEQRMKALQEQQAQLQAMADKIKELEALKATADEAQKKALELEKQRIEEQRRKAQEEMDRRKAEEEQRKLQEQETLQQGEEARKAQEEMARKKADEEQARLAELEKKRAEAAKTKTGDLVPINDVTVQPARTSGSAPAIPISMRTKYKGKTMTIPTTLLVDENGNVTTVKILTGNVPTDVKVLIEDTVRSWKYSPAQKDNVNVKVWLSVPFKFTF